MNDPTALPRSWLECTLGDVVDYGAANKSEPEEIPDTAWVLELEDIESDTSKVLHRVTFAERRSKSTKNRFVEGDILYGKLRPYLNKVVRADQDGYCSTEIIPLSPPAEIDGTYLLSWLRHPRFLEYVNSASHGLNMPRLGTAAGQAAPFVLAPLPEQKRIANKLDALLVRVEACRGRLDRLPGILRRFRQSILAAAASGELTKEWREERGIEDAWRQAALSSLLTDVRYGTSRKCAYEPRKTPVLRIPNVVGGTVSHDDMKYAEFDEREKSMLALAPGDLLMIRSNGSVGLVGRTALVSEREAGFVYAGYLIRLRPDAAQASPAYLSLFLSSPASRSRIELTARSTTGVNNINAEEIRAFPVALPSLDEQYEIVRRVGELFAMAERLDHRLSTAQVIVQNTTPSALAKAFRGELVPQDPNDEPASKLLARLRTRADSDGSAGKPKRGDARARRSNAKADTNMLTRKDVTSSHLTNILRERGALTAEALWTASQLEIDDFYDQLKDEEARGLLRENRGEAPNAPTLLEPAA